MDMNVLITGGYGNLGGWLLRHLSLSTDWKITVLSKNASPAYSKFNHTFIACDIANAADVQSKLDNSYFHTVFHLASVNDSFTEGYDNLARKVNIQGTAHILDAIGDNCKHFIYLSTFQVYGCYSGAISESFPTNPKNTYAQTHLDAEGLVEKFGIPYSIIRLTNSYGCPIDVNTSKWYLILNDLSRMAFKEKTIRLNGNGQIERDFIPMQLVCEIFRELAQLSGTNKTFNLGGQTTSLEQVAKAVQLAYKTKFGFCIPIQAPVTTPLDGNLKVDCNKLQSLIPYTIKDEMVSESLAIFQLLENNA